MDDECAERRQKKGEQPSLMTQGLRPNEEITLALILLNEWQTTLILVSFPFNYRINKVL